MIDFLARKEDEKLPTDDYGRADSIGTLAHESFHAQIEAMILVLVMAGVDPNFSKSDYVDLMVGFELGAFETQIQVYRELGTRESMALLLELSDDGVSLKCEMRDLITKIYRSIYGADYDRGVRLRRPRGWFIDIGSLDDDSACKDY